MITAKSVKELREMTGAGMMDCKKALVETEGNIEKAVFKFCGLSERRNPWISTVFNLIPA